MGPPCDIVLYLKSQLKAERFIETGTFKGWTSYWAAKHFKQVKTIEFSAKIYNNTKEKFKSIENIEFIFGDSRLILPKIIYSDSTNCIFWLDAHWCKNDSYGEEDQCPIIEEIEIINKLNLDHAILIDDARLFLSPPPKPNSVEYYPGINELLNKLTMNIERYVVIYDDVIICLPIRIKDDFIQFMQEKITRDQVRQSKQYKKQLLFKSFKRLIKKVIGYKYFNK